MIIQSECKLGKSTIISSGKMAKRYWHSTPFEWEKIVLLSVILDHWGDYSKRHHSSDDKVQILNSA